MSAVPLEPYATLEAAGIPFHVLGERFAAVCERLEDTAPAWATESDIYRKAGFYLDDRGSLDWEDDDMHKATETETESATDAKARTFDAIAVPREWYAVLDRDGFGDVYPDKARAERDAETYNERIRKYAPFRVVHLREVAA